MKKILAYGDSNTWGFIPGTFNAVNCTALRYPKEERWAGVMAQRLGNKYEVIEEGLCGRTTVLNDPLMPVMTNGKSYLLPCLLSHGPLDLIIIMLGTNDLKQRFNLSPFEVSCGMRQLIILARTVAPNAKILVISPAVTIDDIGDFKHDFKGAHCKSKDLAKYYKEVCTIEQCNYFDAATVCISSAIDGIHLDSASQISLGAEVANLVKEIL